MPNENDIKCMKTKGAVLCDIGNHDIYYQIDAKDNEKNYDYYKCGEIKDYFTKCNKKTISSPDINTTIWLDKTLFHKVVLIDGKNSYHVFYSDTIDLARKLFSYFKFPDVSIIQIINQDFYTDKINEKKSFGFVKNNGYDKILEKLNELFTSSVDHKSFYDYYHVLIIRNPKKIKPPIGFLTTKIINSKINQNLQWADNSCWIDATLMNIFTYKTNLSITIINNMDKNKGNKFNKLLINLLSLSGKIEIMDQIDDLNKYCQENKEPGKMVNLSGKKSTAWCNDYYQYAISSPGNILFLFNNMYNLGLIVPKVSIVSGTLFSTKIQEKQAVMNEQAKSKNFVIVDTSSYHNRPEFDIISNDGVLNKNLITITLNGLKYILTSTTVSTPGHYVSIIYDRITNNYILINKLSKTTVSVPSITNWRRSTFFFYYPDNIIKSSNIITGMNPSTKTLLTGESGLTCG